MAKRLGNYLRLHRREWGLTQAELAFLFGYRDESVVSRFEHSERRIALSTGFACRLLFGIEPEEIFPTLFDQVEDGVVRRMYELYNRLKTTEPSGRHAAKLRLLRDALARTTKRAQSTDV